MNCIAIAATDMFRTAIADGDASLDRCQDLGAVGDADIALLSSHDRSIIMASSTIDPVCGMTVEPEDAAAESEYQGRTYYFCCQDCKRMFDEDPTNYVIEQTAEHAAQG